MWLNVKKRWFTRCRELALAMADIDKSVLLCDNCDDDKKFIEL